MAVAVGSRNGARYSWLFALLYLTLLQVHLMVCQEPKNPLARALRSIARSDYQTIARVQLHEAVYGPKTPFLGELSQPLSDGKIIRVSGYIPADVSEFQINLCADCVNGPLHFHFSVRYISSVVVRNSYENDRWQTEERDSLTGTFPFQNKQEFVIQIEVKPAAYFVSLNGNLLWKFNHRVPYSTVSKIEIKGGSLVIWKIEYTDRAHEGENEIFPIAYLDGKHLYHLNGDSGSPMTIQVGGNPHVTLEKFTVDLKCECTPQNSTAYDSEIGNEK